MTKKKKEKSKLHNGFSLFIDRKTTACFYSFGIEYVPQDLLDKIKDISMTHNIFRTQFNDSVMCGFYQEIIKTISNKKRKRYDQIVLLAKTKLYTKP